MVAIIIIYVFTQLLRMRRIQHKVNFFQQSLTGLNSEFSSSQISCLTKVKDLGLPYYLPIEKIVGFIPFPRVSHCYVKCKQPRSGFEPGLPCSLPMITVTPHHYIKLYKLNLDLIYQLQLVYPTVIHHSARNLQYKTLKFCHVQSFQSIFIKSTKSVCGLHFYLKIKAYAEKSFIFFHPQC